jgi:SAM-dependent methyltransferase
MTALDFSVRSMVPELMDTEAVSFEEFRACLQDLARVNRLTMAHRPTLAFLERVMRRHPGNGGPVQILDVGSGYGDLLREVRRWALRWRLDVQLTGVDLNPWSRRAAEEATPESDGIRFVTGDVFAYEPPEGVDIVISSLFTHHLSDPQVVRFLRWMQETARYGWFINDLQRHPLPYHFFRRFSRLAHYHRFVQHDGPVSIARAFSRADWQRLLREADLAEHAEVHWKFPFKLNVEARPGARELTAEAPPRARARAASREGSRR